MRTSEAHHHVYRRLYLASEFLLRHRSVCIFGAFIVWALILIKSGYFDEHGYANTGFLLFGFLWMTFLCAIATCLIPRIILRAVPLMNGYVPQQD